MPRYHVDTGFSGEGYSRRWVTVEAENEEEARREAVAAYTKSVDTREVVEVKA